MSVIIATLIGLCALSSLASPTYEVMDKRAETSDQIYVVFSGDTFETIPPPDGDSQSSYSAGFSMFTGSGANIYNSQSIDGYAPCVDRGDNITVSGLCLGEGFLLRLSCAANTLGTPGSCAAWSGATGSDLLDCAKSNATTYNDFITTGNSGACVLSFYQSNACASDNDLTFNINHPEDNGPPCDPCPSCD